jgi:hypothetical protein
MVAKMSQYQARVSQDGRFWFVQVYDATDTHVGDTQARHLREVEVMARDLVHILTDADPATIDITTHIEVPPEVQVHLDQAEALTEESARAQHAAAAEKRAAIRALTATGLSLRDAGAILGLSYQRVHQLTKAA